MHILLVAQKRLSIFLFIGLVSRSLYKHALWDEKAYVFPYCTAQASILIRHFDSSLFRALGSSTTLFFFHNIWKLLLWHPRFSFEGGVNHFSFWAVSFIHQWKDISLCPSAMLTGHVNLWMWIWGNCLALWLSTLGSREGAENKHCYTKDEDPENCFIIGILMN